MFVALNLNGIETIHSSEPIYNRLYDRWDSICKVPAPKGTLNLLSIISKDVASYEINSYTNNKAIIDSTNKINF